MAREKGKRRLQVLIGAELSDELRRTLRLLRKTGAVRHLHRGPIREGAVVEAALESLLPALQSILQPPQRPMQRRQSSDLAHPPPSPLHSHLMSMMKKAVARELTQALSLRGALAVVGFNSLQGPSTLPWRHESDLYRLYIAEVLLRRTTRKSAERAYKAILKRYPTADHLSRATPSQVEELLRVHQVGLHQRSTKIIEGATLIRNLDVTALANQSYDPLTKELKKLPLVGNYTADALSLHTFGRVTLPLDKNAARVLWRSLLGSSPPLHLKDVYKDLHLQELRELLVAYAAPRTTQLMHFGRLDVGWTHCKSVKPKCDSCPLSSLCAYPASR